MGRAHQVARDRNDFVRFFDIAAEKAGTHLFVDNQAAGWVVARHVAVVGGDEGMVWGGLQTGDSEWHIHHYDDEGFFTVENYGDKKIDRLLGKIGAEQLESKYDASEWKVSAEQLAELFKNLSPKPTCQLGAKALAARRKNAAKARRAKAEMAL